MTHDRCRLCLMTNFRLLYKQVQQSIAATSSSSNQIHKQTKTSAIKNTYFHTRSLQPLLKFYGYFFLDSFRWFQSIPTNAKISKSKISIGSKMICHANRSKYRLSTYMQMYKQVSICSTSVGNIKRVSTPENVLFNSREKHFCNLREFCFRIFITRFCIKLKVLCQTIGAFIKFINDTDEF